MKSFRKQEISNQDQWFKLTIAVFFTVWAVASLVIAGETDSPKMDRPGFEKRVWPFLAKHCSGCHGEDSPEAELNLLGLNPDMAFGNDTTLWNEVLDQLVARRMPPAEEPRPEADELTSMIGWLTTELDRAARLRRSTDGRVVIRRMNRKQYNYALQDLLGIERYNNEPMASNMLAAIVFEELDQATKDPLWCAKAEALATAVLQAQHPQTGNSNTGLEPNVDEHDSRQFHDAKFPHWDFSRGWTAQMLWEFAALKSE